VSEPHNGAIIQRDPAATATTGPNAGVAATNQQVAEVRHAEDAGPFYKDPEFWVAIGFLLFVALLLYLKVQKSAGAALDARGARIKHDLDEAARLRAEAEALLAQAEARLAASAGDAAAIVDQANRQAREIAEQGARDLEALIARRTKSAEDRIAAARRTADADLRARAVDLAAARARDLIAGSADTALQTRLTDAAIADLARV
jgi:F-type H+-transporting ATPase subunit b